MKTPMAAQKIKKEIYQNIIRHVEIEKNKEKMI